MKYLVEDFIEEEIEREEGRGGEGQGTNLGKEHRGGSVRDVERCCEAAVRD